MNSHQDRVGQSFRRVEGWFVANPQYTAKDGPASSPALATQLDALHGIGDHKQSGVRPPLEQALDRRLVAHVGRHAVQDDVVGRQHVEHGRHVFVGEHVETVLVEQDVSSVRPHPLP